MPTLIKILVDAPDEKSNKNIAPTQTTHSPKPKRNWIINEKKQAATYKYYENEAIVYRKIFVTKGKTGHVKGFTPEEAKSKTPTFNVKEKVANDMMARGVLLQGWLPPDRFEETKKVLLGYEVVRTSVDNKCDLMTDNRELNTSPKSTDPRQRATFGGVPSTVSKRKEQRKKVSSDNNDDSKNTLDMGIHNEDTSINRTEGETGIQKQHSCQTSEGNFSIYEGIMTVVPWIAMPLGFSDQDIDKILKMAQSRCHTKWFNIFNGSINMNAKEYPAERMQSPIAPYSCSTSTPEVKKLCRKVLKMASHVGTGLGIRDMVFLKSVPNCPAQELHTDGVEKGVVAGIVALQPNTSLIVRDVPDKEARTIPIPRNTVILFRSNLVHAGAPNLEEIPNIRIHFYLRPDAVMVEDNAEYITKVGYFQCPFCSMSFKQLAYLNQHLKRNKKCNTLSLKNRKLVRKAAKKGKQKIIELDIKTNKTPRQELEEVIAGYKEEDKEEDLELMLKRKAKDDLEDKVVGEKEVDKEKVKYNTRRSKRLMRK